MIKNIKYKEPRKMEKSENDSENDKYICTTYIYVR